MKEEEEEGSCYFQDGVSPTVDRSNSSPIAAIWNPSSFYVSCTRAATSDEQQLTSHCDRAIPYSTKDLHYAHCSPSLQKCKVCGYMVPKQFAEEHFLSTHAPNSQQVANADTDLNTQFPLDPPCAPIIPELPLQNVKKKGIATSSIPKAWDDVEDVALMSAWVFVSENPSVGTADKKSDRFWDGILNMYEQARAENPGELSERSIESLRGRYQRLNKNVTTWIGAYREAYSRKRSGMSMEDVENEAHQIYGLKHKFPHMLVFKKVMCHHPKWELQLEGDRRRSHPDDSEVDEGHDTSKRSRANDDDGGKPTDATPETPGSGASTIRPIGSETAKLKKKGTSVALSPSIFDDFTSELRAMRITREKELEVRNKLGNERMELEKMKMKASLLNVLITKADLSPEEEDLKRRLMASFFP